MRLSGCRVGLLCASLMMLCVLPSLGEGLPDSLKWKVECEIAQGALEVMCALSPAQVHDLQCGRTLDLEACGPAVTASVREAAREVLGDGCYNSRLCNLPEGVKLGLRITPVIDLVFEGGALGSEPETVRSSEVFPGSRKLWKDAAGVECGSMPSLTDIMAGAPSDPEKRASYLRERAYERLSPIGESYLRAGEIPLVLADLTSTRRVSVKSLGKTELAWLQDLYAKHAEQSAAKQKVIRDVLKSQEAQGGGSDPSTLPNNFTVIADGKCISVERSEFREIPLPGWSDIGDATVRGAVMYTIMLSPMSGDCTTKGMGWGMN